MARLPLVSPLDRALFLKTQPYLEGLAANVLAVLASYTEEHFYSAGSTIRPKNAPIERILFLASGAIEVERGAGGTSTTVAIEAPGAIGLPHHFAETKTTPAVRAVADTLCLEIATFDLDQILEDHFSLLLQMARASCKQAVLGLEGPVRARRPEAGFEKADMIHTPVALDLVQRLARARNAPFLHHANLTMLGVLLRVETPEMVREGETIWREGDPIERMALVLDGNFRSDGRLGECLAPTGAMLGAWEIFHEAPRAEGWVAQTPSRVLSIRKELFTDLLEDHFEFAQTYLRMVSEKILEGWGEQERR